MMRTPSPFPVPPAIELTPSPLLFVAAIVPAMCVPWSAPYFALGLPLFSAKLYPLISSTYPFPSSSVEFTESFSPGFTHRLATRSLCLVATPWSNTATITLGSPAVSLQASFTPTSAPSTAFAEMDLSPVLIRFHWIPSSGSSNGCDDDGAEALVMADGTYSYDSSEKVFSSNVLYSTYWMCSLETIFSAALLTGMDTSKLTVYHLLRPCLAAALFFLQLSGNNGDIVLSERPSRICSRLSTPVSISF